MVKEDGDIKQGPVKPRKRQFGALRDALGAADADRPKVLRPDFGDRPWKKALEARASLRPKPTDDDSAISKKPQSKPEKKVGPRRPDKARHHDDAA